MSTASSDRAPCLDRSLRPFSGSLFSTARRDPVSPSRTPEDHLTVSWASGWTHYEVNRRSCWANQRGIEQTRGCSPGDPHGDHQLGSCLSNHRQGSSVQKRFPLSSLALPWPGDILQKKIRATILLHYSPDSILKESRLAVHLYPHGIVDKEACLINFVFLSPEDSSLLPLSLRLYYRVTLSATEGI